MQISTSDTTCIYRILDANINRLREGLRVVEEYFRFIEGDAGLSVQLKEARHRVRTFENGLQRKELLEARDVTTDPFADVTRSEELDRSTPADTAAASLKRCQEAARVLEEYIKLTPVAALSQTAKELRFLLYTFEKNLQEHYSHGKKERR